MVLNIVVQLILGQAWFWESWLSLETLNQLSLGCHETIALSFWDLPGALGGKGPRFYYFQFPNRSWKIFKKVLSWSFENKSQGVVKGCFLLNFVLSPNTRLTKAFCDQEKQNYSAKEAQGLKDYPTIYVLFFFFFQSSKLTGCYECLYVVIDLYIIMIIKIIIKTLARREPSICILPICQATM